MPNVIDRSRAEALIREQVVSTIFQDAPKQSVVMQLGRKLPNMTSKQTRIPVLSMLPLAYWVNGDTGYKQTSRQAWENVYLTAGELAVIVPIPEAVLADAEFDILGEVTPRVNEAIGLRVDHRHSNALNLQKTLTEFGCNIKRPAEWQNDIITVARQAGNNVSGGISYVSLLGENGLFAKVEDAGYTVDGVVAAMGAKASLRGIKDTNGHPLYKSDMQGTTPYALDGAPIYFPENGSFDTSVARMVAGNFKQLVYAIRQDVDVKILDQAVIQDPSTKDIIFNLAQQDMIALRVTFRMGWAMPNPATRMNENRVNVPFAYIDAATAYTDQTVTFTVKDNAESSPNAIAGAAVNVNGSIRLTGTDGTAVFHLRAGEYPYSVKADGYRPQTGTVTVAAAAVPVAVTLPASK